MDKFVPLDFSSWPRREHFYYFSKMAPTGYSLTVRLDVTELLGTLKKAGLKFYPAYLWLVTRNLNRQPEFRIAEKDGCLGYYETLTPLYAVFHEDDHTFSFMWTAYQADFKAFHQSYLDNQSRYGAGHGILARKDKLPPENAYTVSCVPWVCFQSFAVHSYENKAYFFPSVEAGQFAQENGRILLPLSITCHHATTDGWHISRFLHDLQSDANRFEDFLS